MQIIAIIILAVIVLGLVGAFISVFVPKNGEEAVGCLGEIFEALVPLIPVVLLIGLIVLIAAALGAFN